MELNYTFYIAATKEVIWDILTTPEGSAAIFYGAAVHSDFVPGASIEYIGSGRGGDQTLHIHGEIIEARPGKSLVHTSNVGDVYLKDTPAHTSRLPTGFLTLVALSNWT